MSPAPSPAFAVVARADVKVGGAALPAETLAELLDLRAQLPLDAPAQAILRFYDQQFALMDGNHFQVGAEIVIDMPDQAGSMHTVFTGEVVSVGAEQGPNHLNELVVVAYDRSHRLGRSSQGRTFLERKYEDVVKQIASEHGMTSKVTYLGNTKYAYLLQTGDNAAFLTETARRTGAQWKVDGNVLTVFRPPLSSSPAATLEWEANLLSFRARFSASDWNSEVAVRGWDPGSKRAIVGTDSASPSFLAKAELATGNRSKSSSFGTAKRVVHRRAVTSAAEAAEVAAAYRSRTGSEEVLARGECIGNPAVAPGEMVAVTGMGRRVSGEYYVTEVEHVLTNRGYVTRFTAGSMEPASVADLAGGAATTGTGISIGIVSNLDDPDGLGRVKVKFPVLGDNLESDWARVVTPAAGGTRGMMMMPSVNDEVLVVFEQSDARRAFVIGGVWNGVDKPPLAKDDWLQSGKVVRWGFTTPSGHKLHFDDADTAKGKLEIVLSDGATKLVLGKDKVELIANSKNLEIKSGQASVLLAESGDVTVKGQKVSIEAQVELKLAGQTLSASGTQVKVAADAKLELNGNAQTSVASSGITEVKGSMVKIN